jgi:hypothetical protein
MCFIRMHLDRSVDNIERYKVIKKTAKRTVSEARGLFIFSSFSLLCYTSFPLLFCFCTCLFSSCVVLSLSYSNLLENKRFDCCCNVLNETVFHPQWYLCVSGTRFHQ